MKDVQVKVTLVSYRRSKPADWWQALKDLFAPEWFLSRWPVVKTMQEVEPPFHTYPYDPEE